MFLFMSLFFNVLYNIYIYKYKNIKNVKNIKHNFLLIIKLIARNLIKKKQLAEDAIISNLDIHLSSLLNINLTSCKYTIYNCLEQN